MDFEEAVAYMNGLLRFGIKLGNERMAALCERLGNPQARFRVVHTAGTKGKGSTTALAASILHSAGYRVGAYFSPYVYDVCERVQINGEPIPHTDFARLVTHLRPHVEALSATEYGPVTEFELKTALGFLHFAEQNVDFGCVEVGIGGRLDATNIVDPLVTIITNIGLDHTQILGDTHARIAFEKAGIIKPGVPCLTAVDNPEAYEVIARIAGERNAPLFWVGPASPPTPPLKGRGVDASSSLSPLQERAGEIRWTVNTDDVNARHTAPVTIETPTHTYENLAMRMGGLYQRANAACAVGAIEIALAAIGRELPDEAVRQALATTSLPGRLTVVSLPDGPLVVLDGAHNEMAAQALAGPVAALREQYRIEHTLLVIGMLTGHEPEGVLAALTPGVERVYCCQPQWKRAQSASLLAQVARHYVSEVQVIESVPQAVQTALADAGPHDMVLITGSFYTVGETPLTLLTEPSASRSEGRRASDDTEPGRMPNRV